MGIGSFVTNLIHPHGMNVLLIGSGGREHAIAWKLVQSPLVDRLTVLPGNPGMASLPKTTLATGVGSSVQDALAFAKREKFDLTVVGPEKPLADGIVDLFQANGLTIFGPSQKAAALESSKAFSKDVMRDAKVPTAASVNFTDLAALRAHLADAAFPVVLKADGLAQGKGVAICRTRDEALAFAHGCMDEKRFGDAGRTVVVEEFLEGAEVSFLVFASGRTFVSMDAAQDHKTLLDGEQGPNTGGMGAVSPANLLSREQRHTIEGEVIQPVLDLLAARGTPFHGVLYAGLMMTKAGPKVLEFNVRFGDPETQVLLPRLQDDLCEIFLRIARGEPMEQKLRFDPQFAVGVVLASEGYPDAPILGREIALPAPSPDVLVFHAGTKADGGKLLTAGGRVLTVTALDEHLSVARDKVYVAAARIEFAGKVLRTDIGAKLMGL